MKSTVQKNRTRFSFLVILAISFFAFVGCNKDSVEPDLDATSLSANEDAAESLASTVGEDTGGLTDQMGDLMSLTTNDGFNKLGKVTDGEEMTREYDPATGAWTITIARERGNPGSVPYASISRIYTVQFLNEAGSPQMKWITNGDTARTVKFDIVEGIGLHKTRRLNHELTALSGSFVATNAHTQQVTINGTYFRAGLDTVTTRNAVRTLDHSLDLTLTDVVGPRGSRRDLSSKISGTITGTYHSFITFMSNSGNYRETEIDRSISITLNGGNSEIQVGSETYQGDIQSGELQNTN